MCGIVAMTVCARNNRVSVNEIVNLCIFLVTDCSLRPARPVGAGLGQHAQGSQFIAATTQVIVTNQQETHKHIYIYIIHIRMGFNSSLMILIILGVENIIPAICCHSI